MSYIRLNACGLNFVLQAGDESYAHLWLQGEKFQSLYVHFDGQPMSTNDKVSHVDFLRVIKKIDPTEIKNAVWPYITGLILKPVRYDSGNDRLYVKDRESGHFFVIVDHGSLYDIIGLPRFQLCSHSKDGEPCSSVKKSWVLQKGVDKTHFHADLRYVMELENA